MAHTKSQGAAKRTVNIIGKRLGVKKFSGEYVKAGSIIIRQRGSSMHPGKNAMMGRDYTIFASAEGFVSFRHMTGYKRAQKFVDVLPQIAAVSEVKVEKKPVVKAAIAKKTTTAKPKTTAAKKPATKKAAA
jgi:large subunit ribosomal protein L27